MHGEVARDRTNPLPAGEWDGALALGQLALSHELIGAARTMLELARQHALERIAVRAAHRDVPSRAPPAGRSLIAIEAADSLVAGAWDEPSPVLAAMAKGMAGQGARTAAKHCQQVLAGIGFTAEHAFHHFYKRGGRAGPAPRGGQLPSPASSAPTCSPTGTLPPSFAL